MNDTTQMVLAAALELGLPAVLAITALVWPRIRLWAVVVLGAVTPLLLSCPTTTARFLIRRHGPPGFEWPGIPPGASGG